MIFRGINKADIFFDDEDRLKLLYVFQDLKEKEHFQVYAYCVMTNHVHMLLRTTGSLGNLMQKALGRYVIWYNAKYERVGHLFQDRFYSTPVENKAYFLAALQYIFNNPVTGGLANNAIDYKWSNCCQLFWQVRGIPLICEPYEQLPAKPYLLDSDMGMKNFEIPEGVSDNKVREWSMEILGLEDWKDVQNIGDAELKNCVKELMERGAYRRSIARVLGMSRHGINRIIKEVEKR